MEERITDRPRFVPDDYETKYKEPCIPDEDNDYDVQKYTGTGVALEEHPLNGRIRMRSCGNCESNNVKVIYARWCVSVHTGNVYWDYELFCEDCKKYTSRSFADN